jgi:2-polyprenyl-3-methyl-5-hydroxy-6-metoxy-1,4-benzoquinol methylase
MHHLFSGGPSKEAVVSKVGNDRAATGRNAYPLGHSKREIMRLADQARMNDPITRSFLVDSGICPGMRVLEVGCAAGHFTYLLADIVGPAGEVIGVDRAADAVAAAREGAELRALTNVSFHQGDPSEMTFDRPFDAVAARWVIMFIPDKVEFIRKLSGHLRPGGIMFFQEVDRTAARSHPPAPLYDTVCQWVTNALIANGDEVSLGSKLFGVFVAAGLPPPLMRVQALIGGGKNFENELWQLAELLRPLIPAMEKHGVVTAAQIGIDDLSDRLLAEAIATNSVLVDRSEIGVWARKAELSH